MRYINSCLILFLRKKSIWFLNRKVESTFSQVLLRSRASKVQSGPIFLLKSTKVTVTHPRSTALTQFVAFSRFFARIPSSLVPNCTFIECTHDANKTLAYRSSNEQIMPSEYFDEIALVINWCIKWSVKVINKGKRMLAIYSEWFGPRILGARKYHDTTRSLLMASRAIMEGKQIGKSKKSPAEKKEGEKTLYWESNQSKVEMEWEQGSFGMVSQFFFGAGI